MRRLNLSIMEFIGGQQAHKHLKLLGLGIWLLNPKKFEVIATIKEADCQLDV
jgi:hypothetical protein